MGNIFLTLATEVQEEFNTTLKEEAFPTEPLTICHTTSTELLEDTELRVELLIIEGTMLMKLLTQLIDIILGDEAALLTRLIDGTEEDEGLIIPAHTAEDSFELDELLIPIEELDEEKFIRMEALEDFILLILMDVITDEGWLSPFIFDLEDSTLVGTQDAGWYGQTRMLDQSGHGPSLGNGAGFWNVQGRYGRLRPIWDVDGLLVMDDGMLLSTRDAGWYGRLRMLDQCGRGPR